MRSLIAALFCILALTACGQATHGTKATTAQVEKQTPLTPASRTRALALKQLGRDWLGQLADCTLQLEADAHRFLAASHQAALDNLKQMLHTCQTLSEASELLVGVSPQQQAAMQKVRTNLASPLTRYAHLDTLINSDLPLGETTLREQQTTAEEANLGFDVIAYLVYGEQYFNPQIPERRLQELTYKVSWEKGAWEKGAWEDGRRNLPINLHPQNRRRLYLQIAATLAKRDSARLLEVWNRGPLPFSEQAAVQWQAQALQNGLALLERYPGNSDVQMALNQWLNQITNSTSTEGAMTVATDPSLLRDDVQQTLVSLLTKPR